METVNMPSAAGSTSINCCCSRICTTAWTGVSGFGTRCCSVPSGRRSRGGRGDPNRPDEPQYILRLLAQVITVTLETVKVVTGLPALEIQHCPTGLIQFAAAQGPRPKTKFTVLVTPLFYHGPAPPVLSWPPDLPRSAPARQIKRARPPSACLVFPVPGTVPAWRGGPILSTHQPAKSRWKQKTTEIRQPRQTWETNRGLPPKLP